jgi:putative SOS response-associated peptidase YedK
MRWGLVPAWAKDIKIGYSTFNARAEDIANRPVFRGAWKAGRRCLVIADGYYEWRDSDKQPFAVTLGNRGPMTFAGLWDVWHAPDGMPLKSFAIVTTQANELLRPLHDRMPVLLAPDCWAAWLGDIAALEGDLKSMLKPYRGRGMAFWPVDKRVGNPRNDSPDLFAPLNELLSPAGVISGTPGWPQPRRVE